MERLKNERKSDVHRKIQEKRPLRKVGKVLVESLMALAMVGIVSSCSASAQVSARSSAVTSATSQPAGFGTPNLHASEIRVRREGDIVSAEVHEITGIQCDAINRCETSSVSLTNPTVSFEVYDSDARRFRAIEGCPNEERACDISSVPRGAQIRIRFVPAPDFERPIRGTSTRTER